MTFSDHFSLSKNVLSFLKDIFWKLGDFFKKGEHLQRWRHWRALKLWLCCKEKTLWTGRTILGEVRTFLEINTFFGKWGTWNTFKWRFYLNKRHFGKGRRLSESEHIFGVCGHFEGKTISSICCCTSSTRNKKHLLDTFIFKLLIQYLFFFKPENVTFHVFGNSFLSFLPLDIDTCFVFLRVQQKLHEFIALLPLKRPLFWNFRWPQILLKRGLQDGSLLWLKTRIKKRWPFVIMDSSSNAVWNQ